MRTLPNMVVMAPKDENECRQMLHTAYQHAGPAAVRYPRGTGCGSVIDRQFAPLMIGQSEQLLHIYPDAPRQVALLAFGSMVMPSLSAAQQLASDTLGVVVINMRFIKPLDVDCLRRLAEQGMALVTLEEHAVMAGAGSAVNEALHAMNQHVPVRNLGLPDVFLEHGPHADLLAHCGLDATGIVASVREFMNLT